MEDRDNSFYDSRLVPADKKLLADWQWKIKKIKQQERPKEYLETRDEWLKNAERERIKNGLIPASMHDVPPPWDRGHGLALSRYNDASRHLPVLRREKALFFPIQKKTREGIG
jgi:hypothetical protein